MSINFSKYLNFQKKNYPQVYADVLNKYYDSGWVEYILPRLESQCDSKRSYGTGLNSQKEVEKFWNNKLLRNNYINIIKLFNNYTYDEYQSIITDRGKYKIKQSVELFLPYAKDNDLEELNTFISNKYASM